MGPQMFIDALEKSLARMTVEERRSQARSGGADDKVLAAMAGEPVPPDLGEPLVKIDATWSDPSRPRSDVQLVAIVFEYGSDLDSDRPAAP